MPKLPERPSLEHLRKQAKARKRERGIALNQAQHEIARDYGFPSWPRLVGFVQAGGLESVQRALVLADAPGLSALLRADPAAATAPLDGLPPLLVLLHRSTGTAADVRDCARVLLEGGADPDGHTIEWDGQGRQTALFDAVERRDLALARLLVERGATRDEDAFYHACEQSDTAFLDLLYVPGFEDLVNHKLDFEDAEGIRWFLDHGADVNANRCLHHAIARGRGLGSWRCCWTPAPTWTRRGTAGMWAAVRCAGGALRASGRLRAAGRAWCDRRTGRGRRGGAGSGARPERAAADRARRGPARLRVPRARTHPAGLRAVGCATTAPPPATTRPPSRRCWQPTPPPTTWGQPATPKSTPSWPGTPHPHRPATASRHRIWAGRAGRATNVSA
jgi:hypothetical protein